MRRAACLLLALLTLLFTGCGVLDAPAATQPPAPEATVMPEPISMAAAETPEPTAAPTASPTPVPTATPVPQYIRLIESENVPLPAEGEVLAQGEHWNFHGTVESTSALLSVSVTVENPMSDSTVYPYQKTVTFDPAADVRAYTLTSADTLEARALSELVNCTNFKEGLHEITIAATSAEFPEGVTLANVSFTVTKMDIRPLTQNKFRENYLYALSFFGAPERFMYNYTPGKEWSVNIEESWRETYLTKSSLGRCHVDALGQMEQAYAYMQNTRVRVRGANGDSGVIQLYKLVGKEATYNPRFVKSLRYVSHHSFGTAIDVNDDLYPNKNSTENWERIRADVQEHLVYNGILTDESGSYYDFTYDGSYTGRLAGVPYTVVNYLLYELAFYRAGFFWGYYYPHTCDAMHFSLSERPASLHDAADTGLRKVFTYAD